MGRNWCFVGVDLGQSHDFTAIAGLERAELTGEWDPVVYAWRKKIRLRLRYLERPPLGTPYPDVVERVARVTRSAELAGRHLIVDATGGGEAERISQGYYHIPKRDLIIRLQVLLQEAGLQIAAGLEHGRTLVKELAEIRVKVTSAGHEQYGAGKKGRTTTWYLRWRWHAGGHGRCIRMRRRGRMRIDGLRERGFWGTEFGGVWSKDSSSRGVRREFLAEGAEDTEG